MDIPPPFEAGKWIFVQRLQIVWAVRWDVHLMDSYFLKCSQSWVVECVGAVLIHQDEVLFVVQLASLFQPIHPEIHVLQKKIFVDVAIDGTPDDGPIRSICEPSRHDFLSFEDDHWSEGFTCCIGNTDDGGSGSFFCTHNHLGCDSFLANNFLNVWNGVHTCLIHIPQLIWTNIKPVSCFSHLEEEIIYNPFGDRHCSGKGGLLRVLVLEFRESLVETFLPIPTQFGHVFIFVLMQVNNISMGKLWFWASDSQVANPSQPFSLQRER